ncbi:hypothetical protein M2175_001176 [Bradyrhizobium elkanii]|uniref:hypothetical protein n=1 Tax=Bradyrhizobium TaxID=374 RepID=UPI002169E42B|nr:MULTISPECIES: hypothetical protein [Bradyrhizobium]MCS3926145.1 hypothetical protein [Bradyrhizobium elkanii]MCS3966697.1 hypothetical protein [Bradyrhizobium japonicum]
MDERYATGRPLVIDGPAPPIAHSDARAFIEAVRRRDLIIDVEELPFLLFLFHSSLHGLDREGQITARASEGVFCFRTLSWRLGLALLRQRLLKIVKSSRNVVSTAREREAVKITQSFLADCLLDKPAQLVGIDRREGILLIAGILISPMPASSFFLLRLE